MRHVVFSDRYEDFWFDSDVFGSVVKLRILRSAIEGDAKRERHEIDESVMLRHGFNRQLEVDGSVMIREVAKRCHIYDMKER